MKIRFEKNGAQFVATRLGRVVFATPPNEPEAETGYFDDAAAQEGLEALARRLVAEGWVELRPAPAPAPVPRTPWVPTAEAVLTRLDPVLSPASRALLEPLLVHGALSVVGDDLHCALGDDPENELRFTGAGADARTPRPLAAFLDECGGLEMGTVGETGQLVLHDGFRGTLDAVGDADWPAGTCSPIDLDLGAYYVFHPETGDLWFTDEGRSRVNTNDAVEVYLREVHLRLKSYQPSTPLEQAVSQIGHRHTWRAP